MKKNLSSPRLRNQNLRREKLKRIKLKASPTRSLIDKTVKMRALMTSNSSTKKFTGNQPRRIFLRNLKQQSLSRVSIPKARTQSNHSPNKKFLPNLRSQNPKPTTSQAQKTKKLNSSTKAQNPKMQLLNKNPRRIPRGLSNPSSRTMKRLRFSLNQTVNQ